jgi:hypothetical protein
MHLCTRKQDLQGTHTWNFIFLESTLLETGVRRNTAAPWWNWQRIIIISIIQHPGKEIQQDFEQNKGRNWDVFAPSIYVTNSLCSISYVLENRENWIDLKLEKCKKDWAKFWNKWQRLQQNTLEVSTRYRRKKNYAGLQKWKRVSKVLDITV